VPFSRLTLTDFRSYASASLEPGAGFVLLFGENGAGKTNLIEAVSMFAPGRGLRGAALSEMARQSGPGGWAAAARLGQTDIGTGTLASAPDRRQVRINGAPAAVNSLSEWLAVLWLTPAMDRLFTGSAGERRRFLDRLVLALEPAHAHHSTRYDAAMRARNKLLADERWDEAWLASLELAMAEHGASIAEARARTVAGSTKGWRTLLTTNSQALRLRWKAGPAATSPRSSPVIASAMQPPAGPPRARTARTSRSLTGRRGCRQHAPRPASRRRCCSGWC
jgi:DNA replication and repair protein RecF